MKKALFLIAVLLAGLGLGGGAAMATVLLLGPGGGGGSGGAHSEAEPSFVDGGKILAPLVFADGRLAGYVQFHVQLQVPEDKVDHVTARMPMLMHAINMRTFRTPMAAGPDGLLPDIEVFRKIVLDVAPEAFGRGVVRRVAVTQATPA